jgi:ribosomal protein L37AE/L43A
MTAPKFDQEVPARCPNCHSTRIMEMQTDKWICFKCKTTFGTPELDGAELGGFLQNALNTLLRNA